MVSGPTRVRLRRRRSRASASDAAVTSSTSPWTRGTGVVTGMWRHTSSGNPPSPRSSTVAAALVTVARVVRRLRMIPGSAQSRSTSASS